MKFDNAILRSFSREGLPAIDTIKRKNKRYSVKYSLPVWFGQSIDREEYGERAGAIFKSLYQRNKSSIRVIDLDEKEGWLSYSSSSSSLLARPLVKNRGSFAGALLV